LLKKQNNPFTSILTPLRFFSWLSEIQGVDIVLYPEVQNFMKRNPKKIGCRVPGPMIGTALMNLGK